MERKNAGTTGKKPLWEKPDVQEFTLEEVADLAEMKVGFATNNGGMPVPMFRDVYSA